MFEQRSVSSVKVGAVIFAIALFWLANRACTVPETDLQKAAKTFDPVALRHYRDTCLKLNDYASVRKDSVPNVLGKLTPSVLILDEDGKLAAIHMSVGPKWRASSPEDVGTVVVLNCEGKPAGNYVHGTPIFAESCEIPIVDWPTKRLVARLYASSGNAPDVVARYKTVSLYANFSALVTALNDNFQWRQ